MRCLSTCLLLLILTGPACHAADDAKYLLAPELTEGDTSRVQVTLEVGGDLLVNDEATGATKKLPLTVAGELSYTEQLLTWSADASAVTRAWREYQKATAKIQVEKTGVQRDLPNPKRSVIVEIRDGHAVLDGAEQRLTRDQFDLVNVVGNSLSLNHLLPGRELSEGDDWNHEADEIAALLGMDNVAVCEVRSVVTGSEHQQVQIRMAGTVHGTIDGAPTEIEVRGAYLFHQQLKRVTKFNLAIKESRTASPIVPGLDIVAKVSLTVEPVKEQRSSGISDRARDISNPLEAMLSYDATQQGYRFLHDRAWYVTSESSDLIALRSLHNGNQTSPCNLTTLPARSAGR